MSGVDVEFGATRLLTDVTFTVGAGDRWGIVGRNGTGKTTLGLIYAKALFCEATDDGEPCGACGGCKGFGDIGRGFPDFQRFECGENSKVEEVKNLVDMARVTPWSGNQ